jgi:hypothetical protein
MKRFELIFTLSRSYIHIDFYRRRYNIVYTNLVNNFNDDYDSNYAHHRIITLARIHELNKSSPSLPLSSPFLNLLPYSHSLPLSLSLSIYIYICVCVCVCLGVYLYSSPLSILLKICIDVCSPLVYTRRPLRAPFILIFHARR